MCYIQNLSQLESPNPPNPFPIREPPHANRLNRNFAIGTPSRFSTAPGMAATAYHKIQGTTKKKGVIVQAREGISPDSTRRVSCA